MQLTILELLDYVRPVVVNGKDSAKDLEVVRHHLHVDCVQRPLLLNAENIGTYQDGADDNAHYQKANELDRVSCLVRAFRTPEV